MAKESKDLASPESETTDVKSTNAKPWLWRSGDPNRPKGGRPKGRAAKIRELVPPEKLVDAFIEIAFDSKVSVRDRMEALRWISDHGYGKAPETHLVGAMTEEQRDAAAELTRDQLLSLIEAGPAIADLPSGSAAPVEVAASQMTVDAEGIE